MSRSLIASIVVIAVVCSVALAGRPAMVVATGRGQKESQAPRLGLRADASEEPAPLSGIDVSSYQHPGGAAIGWRSVAAAGYSFAYIKATEGTYYANPYYAGDVIGATAAGLSVGAYTFANPGAASGTADADYLLADIHYTNNGQTLPPMLDLESDPYQAGDTCWGLSAGGMLAWISAFVDEIRAQTAQYTLIYTSASWWSQCTGSSSAFSSDPLSVASYDSSSPTLPSGWETWSIWQFTSGGSVPGITGATDLDYFSGNSTLLAAFARGVAPAAAQSQEWVATNSNGALEAFLRGGDGQFWTDFQTRAGSNASWSGWHPMGGSWPGEPAVVLDGEGRLELFARGGDGQLWHAYETRAGNPASWSGFSALGGYLPRDPVATVLANGAVDVYAVGGDGALWHDYETVAGSVSSWSGWHSLGGLSPGEPAPIVESGGRVDLFVQGVDDQLWQKYQTVAGSEQSWSAWYPLGGILPGPPAPVLESDGRVDVFVRGQDAQLWHQYQTAAGNERGWSGWQVLGGLSPLDPVVGRNSNGRLEMLVVGIDGQPWHDYQTVAAGSGSWSGWGPLGGLSSSPLALGVSAARGLQVFLVGRDTALWFDYQATPGSSSSWAGWFSLGGTWPSP